ncbi:MipA/OmpV family protein [Solimicrobium silvestre]|uniref:MltA-interacting protein MipA n=1 Tax=Solimicrobium silvestre TaxID=2099400 RepID=A0A2S9GU40_9BURK|nr:MipA/OmpV family protein [Solimicrobium silvestre]PRC91228.1 MltA-interacting protein MipA [Solimicrobium silvestre]
MKKILPLLLMALALNAQAQTADFVEIIPTQYLQKDLTASVGLGIASLPKYADGSKQEILPLPVFNLQWKSGVFFSSVSGFGYNFSANPNWQYGMRLGLLAYQEQSARNRDNGPGNTPTSLTPGVFANYLIDQHFSILTSLSSGAGINNKHNGNFASIGGRYIDRIDDKNRIFAVLSTTWANGQYMQDFYGVTPQQASTYNFPVYDTNAGMLKVKLSLGWDYTINKNWSMIVGGSVTHPLGDAGSSPLVSDKNQVVVYSAAYYRF